MSSGKTDLPQLMTTADWLDAIARSAGVEPSAAQMILDKYGIQAQPTLPRPRTLCMRSVALDGIKEGTSSDGPFTFEWSGLGPGLWAVLSDKNSRGKSTILNVFRSAIRGDFPGRIKPDVWKWLSRIEVRFDVDAVSFRVLVDKPAGEERAEVAHARLSRRQGEGWIDLFDGSPGEGLRTQTSDVFMEELSFAKFQAYNARHEASHSHGWPVISAALFISEPGVAIFGDDTFDALPLRLLQLFMGLPWISTYTAAQTALKQVETDTRRQPSGGAATGRLQQRLSSLEEQLGMAKSRLASRPDRGQMRIRLASLDALLVNLQTEIQEARDLLSSKSEELSRATAVLVEAKRSLQQAQDEMAAGLVFRRLRPVCCPACEARIDTKRYEAKNAGTCVLCGGEEEAGKGDGNERIIALKADVADSEAIVSKVKGEVAAAERNVRALEARRLETNTAISEIKQGLAIEEDAALEIEVAALEARVAELRDLIAAETETPAVSDAADLPVLRAAVKVTKQIFDNRQRDILQDISLAITRLCRKFGVENLAEMDWQTGGKLLVRQGGSTLSFTKLSPGERLRVRIAAALGVVEVARARGYGRHPGFLVLDSPGGQEMIENDVASLLASVQETVNMTEGFQIIVGAVARPELANVVPRDQRRHAEGESFLF